MIPRPGQSPLTTPPPVLGELIPRGPCTPPSWHRIIIPCLLVCPRSRVSCWRLGDTVRPSPRQPAPVRAESRRKPGFGAALRPGRLRSLLNISTSSTQPCGSLTHPLGSPGVRGSGPDPAAGASAPRPQASLSHPDLPRSFSFELPPASRVCLRAAQVSDNAFRNVMNNYATIHSALFREEKPQNNPNDLFKAPSSPRLGPGWCPGV